MQNRLNEQDDKEVVAITNGNELGKRKGMFQSIANDRFAKLQVSANEETQQAPRIIRPIAVRRAFQPIQFFQANTAAAAINPSPSRPEQDAAPTAERTP